MDVDVPQQQVIKHEVSTQTDLSGAVSNQVPSHNSDFVLEILEPMSTDDQLKFMANFLTKFANTHYDVHVNSDFLQFFLDASRHLKECNRPKYMVWLKLLGECVQTEVTPDFQLKECPWVYCSTW